MGDRNRFDVFTEFIQKEFPPEKYRTIADVAGGRGDLSLRLIKAGYSAVIIDPRETNLPRRERRFCRRNGMTVPRKVVPYSVNDAYDFDLVVGLHPDGATRAICESADIADIALVPCCNHWTPGKGDINGLVRRYFSENEIRYSERMLGMDGRNTVIYTQNHPRRPVNRI